MSMAVTRTTQPVMSLNINQMREAMVNRGIFLGSMMCTDPLLEGGTKVTIIGRKMILTMDQVNPTHETVILTMDQVSLTHKRVIPTMDQVSLTYKRVILME